MSEVEPVRGSARLWQCAPVEATIGSMRRSWILIALVALGCADASASAPVHVTRARITKRAHKLELLDGDRVVRSYKVAIGPGGEGPKLREGDNVTPTGHYVLADARPSAKFRTFIAISYPNEADRKRFDGLRASGALPKTATIGGDVGIHGVGGAKLAPLHKLVDWTRGCVAVDDDEIDEIARLVHAGTPVDIDD